MFIDTESCKTAVPGVDNCGGTEAPNSILCVDSTIEPCISSSRCTATIEAAGRNHIVGVKYLYNGAKAQYASANEQAVEAR